MTDLRKMAETRLEAPGKVEGNCLDRETAQAIMDLYESLDDRVAKLCKARNQRDALAELVSDLKQRKFRRVVTIDRLPPSKSYRYIVNYCQGRSWRYELTNYWFLAWLKGLKYKITGKMGKAKNPLDELEGEK